MSLLSYSDVFFCEGFLKNVLNREVHLTDMKVTLDGIQFTGKTGQIGNNFKNDYGFYYMIPISEISKIIKRKKALAHYVLIVTYDQKYYSITKFDSYSALGKKYANWIVEYLNKILSEIIFCHKCGKASKPDLKYCANCGTEL